MIRCEHDLLVCIDIIPLGVFIRDVKLLMPVPAFKLDWFPLL